MTVAELSAILARKNKKYVITTSDGWMLIGPTEDMCLQAWERKQLEIEDLPPEIEAVML